MNALIVQLRLEEPVLATQVQNGEPNSSVSSTYIPGSMLRGALISKYAHGEEKDLHRDTRFYDLFFSGKVQFLNAYPAHPRMRTRMLPKPLSWQTLKENVGDPEADIFEFALMDEVGDEIYKPPKGDYFQFIEDRVQLKTPQLETTVHNTSVDRDRKQEGASQVYRYDALAAGQTFIGVILSENQAFLETEILPLLEGEFLLGGSYGSGYGKVSVKNMGLDENWQEFTPMDGDLSSGVTLTFLSDVILSTESTANVQQTLEKLAGAPLTNAFYSVGLVGGFNRKWGLPLPQAWAVRAGSVFVFPATAKEKLEALALAGIGNRRVDGFGRVAVNLTSSSSLKQSPLNFRHISQEDIELTQESRGLAMALSQRQLRIVMDQYVAQRVGKLAFAYQAFSNLPKSSQLMRARLAAQRAIQARSLQPILDHFDSMTELSRRTWKRARILGEPFESWIREQVNGAEKFNPVVAPSVAGVQANLDPGLRNLTIARIIEGVLKQAAKQAGGGEK